MTVKQWERVLTRKDDHTIWKHESGKFAIHDPDDGVLWIDMSRKAVFGLEYASIPLIKGRTGKECSTIESHAGALQLCYEIGLPWVIKEDAREFFRNARRILSGESQ